MYPTPQELNRPIHLARRDAFYERATELLCIPFHQIDLPHRLQNVKAVLACLKIASKHSFFAAQAPGADPRERDYINFLDLKIENVDSLAAMLQHQAHLEEESNSVSNFLGITREQSLLPAFQFQRRAEDILQSVWHIVTQAQPPYYAMRTACIDALQPAERERYERAYAHFRQESARKYRNPPISATPPPATEVRPAV